MMGEDYILVNHTKKQVISFDRRFHDWSWHVGEWLAKEWFGDRLEIGSDYGDAGYLIYDKPHDPDQKAYTNVKLAEIRQEMEGDEA